MGKHQTPLMRGHRARAEQGALLLKHSPQTSPLSTKGARLVPNLSPAGYRFLQHLSARSMLLGSVGNGKDNERLFMYLFLLSKVSMAAAAPGLAGGGSRGRRSVRCIKKGQVFQMHPNDPKKQQ